MRIPSLLESDLCSAIENDGIDVHFQPQISLATGRLVGFESLARWSHPRTGPVSPLLFIPFAESFGLIRQLDASITAAVCRHIAGWRDAGVDIPLVSVNISSVDVTRAEISNLLGILESQSIDPSEIELELTEGSLANSTTIDALAFAHEQGIRLAVDDFGTGFSSLSYLRRLPIDRLKLDKSFIDPIATDKKSLEIARVIIDLGHSLGLNVIAEGVETHEQASLLLSLGCDDAQGWLYSKALPPDGALALIQDQLPPITNVFSINAKRA